MPTLHRCIGIMCCYMFWTGMLAAQSTPVSDTVIDTVQQHKLLLLGTDYPIAVDLKNIPTTAYRIHLNEKQKRAFRTARLGLDGPVYLISPRKIKAGRKEAVGIFLGEEETLWKINYPVAVTRQLTIGNQTEANGSYMLLHTVEAQYLLATSPKTKPFIVETIGLSHLPNGASLRLAIDQKPASLTARIVILTNDAGTQEQAYIHRVILNTP